MQRNLRDLVCRLFYGLLLETQMYFFLHIRENRCYNVGYDDESIQNRTK